MLALVLAACAPLAPVPAPRPQPAVIDPGARLDSQTAARNFVQVVERTRPIAMRECQARNPRGNCDFLIVIDDRPGQPPNAFQTVQRDGRPVIGFTLALIADARNQDELAFILGHEAGHHIAGHLPRVQQSAAAGALILGTLATLGGAGQAEVDAASRLGASVGARTYSRDFELEADMLGTVVAHRSGFDPERGAAFFSRIPDPGNSFLSTHPPNAQRIQVVRQTLDTLR
jgi:predicted Zn-dependent protease